MPCLPSFSCFRQPRNSDFVDTGGSNVVVTPRKKMRQTVQKTNQNKVKQNTKYNKYRTRHQDQVSPPKTYKTHFIMTIQKRKENPNTVTSHTKQPQQFTHSSSIDKLYLLADLVSCVPVCHLFPAFVNRGFPTTPPPSPPISLDTTRNEMRGAPYSMLPHSRVT